MMVNPSMNPDWEITKFHNVIVVTATLGTKENPLWLLIVLDWEITEFHKSCAVS